MFLIDALDTDRLVELLDKYAAVHAADLFDSSNGTTDATDTIWRISFLYILMLQINSTQHMAAPWLYACPSRLPLSREIEDKKQRWTIDQVLCFLIIRPIEEKFSEERIAG